MPGHHPMAKATMAATALATTSNILAQLLEAYRHPQEPPKSVLGTFTSKQPQAHSFQLDYIQILRYALLVFLTTPPNYIWQGFLERSFPAYGPSGSSGGTSKDMMMKKSDGVREKGGKQRKDSNADLKLHNIDIEKHAGSINNTNNHSAASSSPSSSDPTSGPKKKLNWRNTLAKWFIDCITIGALLNTIAFFVLMGLLKGQPTSQIMENVKTQTIPLIVAGYKVWPFASIISFSMIPVEKRVIFLNFVGLLWGIYMSIIASKV